jgi:adenylate cyclase, class 2
MKEVEVKVKINNLDEVEKKFNEIGVNFSDVIEQEDYIYTRPEVANNMDSIIKDENILRIRKAKGKIMFTLKRPQTGGLDKIEREVEVSDDAQMKDILEYLGYVKAIEVKKKRKIGKYENYEISLDEVEELGTFFEVEAMVEMDEDSVAVQGKIWEFLKTLSIKKEDEVTKGYDVLKFLKGRG